MFYGLYKHKIVFKRDADKPTIDQWIIDNLPSASQAKLIRGRPRAVFVAGDAELLHVKMALQDSIMSVIERSY